MASRSLPCFSFAWEHGNHLPPKLAITESSHLSFVHVLVVVRDCQVDSITNRAMPCREWMSINDVDQRRRSTTSIIDHRSSIIDHRSSIIDHRSSIIDHRSSIIDHRSSIIDHRSSIIDHRSSIIDHRSSIIDHRSSIIDHRSSIIDHRSSIIDHRSSIIDRTQFWYGTVSNKLWMVST